MTPTLGWDVLDWMAEYLPSPSDPSQPLILTDEQARLVLQWYEVDERGEFLYRRGILEMAKGWGKSPLVAAIALAEFAGPVAFDRWKNGEPVGKPHDDPFIQIAAVSEDQTDNTYNVLYGMLTANDHRAAKRLGIDDGRTRLYLKRRSTAELQPVTASAGSREGQRVTFAVLDETHLWTRRNGGVRLASTIRRNAAKMGGRTLETTNAPLLGEHSVAEASGDHAERGFSGILHYAKRPAVEPDPDWSDDRLKAALAIAYGDARWVDLDRLIREMRDPGTPWEDALRYYFNLRVAGAGKAVDPRRWDELAKPRDVPEGTPIGLGFDGSISGDATVLIGCTQDGYSFLIRAWVRPLGGVDWTVPRSEVHDAVATAFSTYRVGRMYADPPRWATEVEQWQDSYGKDPEGKPVVEPFYTSQSRKFGMALDRWFTGIREGTHTHDGSAVLTEHVKAAHREKVYATAPEDDGRTLYRLVKGEDRGRIDAAVADVLAHEAALTMLVPEKPEVAFAWG